MSDNMVPQAALDYIKNKKLQIGFSYKDVWNEEHATAFTVAKAMQIDVLSDMKAAVEKAIENGESFEHFKKNIKPLLMQKGWWGRKDMIDPLTGKVVNAQLGSDRRLKTIYRTNLRNAYQKGSYDRAMASDVHPYLMYLVGPSQHHREEHLKWNNLILPKDDPWWNTHLPPNGYGCKCFIRAVSKGRKDKYEKEGAPFYNPSTHKTEYQKVNTARPKTTYRTYFNERKGIVERVPDGITPGFGWNQGQAGRDFSVMHSIIPKTKKLNDSSYKTFMQTLFDNKIRKEQFANFVENAFQGEYMSGEFTPVGFLDRNVCRWLKDKKGIDIGEDNVIGLESRLIKGIKADRHNIQKDDAHIILDALLYGKTYWYQDPHKNMQKDALVYLYPVNENDWFRIVIRPEEKVKGIQAPFVRSIGYLPNATIENLLLQMIEIK